MITRVLDTSVAAAWYLPEEFSKEARRWQRQMLEGGVQFLVPSLHYWELGNVLRTYVRRGELDQPLAEEIYALHLDASLQVVEPDRRSVLRTALDYESTVYDAVFISLAIQHKIKLLTAERSTTPWVVKLRNLVERID